MPNGFDETPKVPTDPRALRRLERHIEAGDLEELPGLVPSVPRFLVTYMISVTRFRVRSATVVSVTNQSQRPNFVSIAWYKGLTDDTAPVGQTSFTIPPDFTIDFGSRRLPVAMTAINSVCNPELVFDEGRAIISSTLAELGVSSRAYYTAGDKDEELLAITDSKIVRLCQGNSGD
jgi:hypothetical protein